MNRFSIYIMKKMLNMRKTRLVIQEADPETNGQYKER